MRLAWSGGDRVWLTRIVAAVAIENLVEMARAIGRGAPTPPHPDAPGWLLAIAGSVAATIGIAAFGILAALASGRRDAALGWTGAWVVAGAILAEAHAAAGPGPYRGWFFVGAVGLGVVLGRLWARSAARRDLEPAAAELGALALLSACYLGAATSKLGGVGAAWADATTLRAVALAHAHVDAPGLSAWLADAPRVATVLAGATIAIQLGAVGLWLGPRSRVAATVGLVAFHVGVAAFARIGYWSPVVLLLALGLPWPRWIAALRVPTVELDGATTAMHRADRRLALLLVAIVGLAWALPIRAYTDGHHRSRTLDAGATVSREPLVAWGPLRTGEAIRDGWIVDAIEREPSRVMVVLAHPDHGRAVLWISAREPGAGRGSPFDRPGLRIAYEGADRARPFAAAAGVIADRLAADPGVAASFR